MRVQNIQYGDYLNNVGGETDCAVIWFAGCTHKCASCHNPSLWQSNDNTMKLTVMDIMDKLYIWSDSKEVVLLGGEPLDQSRLELKLLCRMLYNNGYKIWLYTGYDEIPTDLKKYLWFAKCGKYEKGLPPIISMGVTLASSNQRIAIYKGEEICASTSV